MKFKAVVKDIRKNWDAFAKDMRDLKDMTVRAGVFANEKNDRPDGQTNVQVAMVNEFGVPGHISERPFIRSSFEAHRETYYADLHKGIKEQVRKGHITYEKLLGQIGARMAADMRKGVTETMWPPNAQSTIEAKGSSQPLVDTGALIKSITWEVDKGEHKAEGHE